MLLAIENILTTEELANARELFAKAQSSWMAGSPQASWLRR